MKSQTENETFVVAELPEGENCKCWKMDVYNKS